MKKRNGFVSNSSSSSFIIIKDKLSNDQIDNIINHIEIAKNIDIKLMENGLPIKYEYYEDWNIKIDEFALWAHTSMDNFSLPQFIEEELNIPSNNLIYIGDGLWGGDIQDDEAYKALKLTHRLNKLNKLRENE